jgi:dihydroorotate dehydrogenase (fumarate)
MDITTTYLGLNLKSPLVVGACNPLSDTLDNIKRLEDSGAAAIVLHSLYEEQIRTERLAFNQHFEQGTESFAEALTYFPEPEVFHVGCDTYLDHIRQAKQTVDVPIIASLNGTSLEGWLDYATLIEEAGADALEINLYAVPTDLDRPAAAVEAQDLEVVSIIRKEVNIPIAVKLSPFFSNMANMAKRFVEHGANGLVLFNRFYEPDIDIENLEVYPHVMLSTPQDMRLPMQWIGILYGRLDVDLAATSGVHKATDVIRMMMAGANITMIVSALLRHGIPHLADIERDLVVWLEEHEYESLQELRGTMSQVNCPDPSQFERVQYMKALQTYHPVWERTTAQSWSPAGTPELVK